MKVKKNNSTNTNPSVKKSKNTFLSNLKYDLESAFVVKPWNISTILLLVPGLLIGLFMGSHIDAIHRLPSGYEATAFYLFVLILLGCVSIFSGFSFAAKRSRFHSIFTIIVSLLMIVFGALYLMSFFQYAAVANPRSFKITDAMLSIICIIASLVCSLGGSIFTAFCVDKKIEKE